MKELSLLDIYKSSLRYYYFASPFCTIFFLVMGIVFCVKNPDILWVGLFLLAMSMCCIIISVFIIRYLRKKIKYLEEREMERYKLEYLASEAIRMKEQQEKGTPKTINDNDSNN